MNRTVRAVVTTAAVTGLAFGLGACSEAADRVDKAVTDEVDKAVNEEIDKAVTDEIDKAVTDEIDKAVNEEYEVTYEVTGTNVDSIDYHASGGTATDPKIETVDKPTLPWKKTVTLRGITPPGVIPSALDVAGAEVKCTITYKGKVIKEAEGAGPVSVGGCITVSPIVQ